MPAFEFVVVCVAVRVAVRVAVHDAVRVAECVAECIVVCCIRTTCCKVLQSVAGCTRAMECFLSFVAVCCKACCSVPKRLCARQKNAEKCRVFVTIAYQLMEVVCSITYVYIYMYVYTYRCT